MRTLLALIFLLAPPAAAQDHVQLSNGDRLTGKVRSMAGGQLIFVSEVFGELKMDMSLITDLQTAAAVRLLDDKGELALRRVERIETGALILGGDGDKEPSRMLLDRLTGINPSEPGAVWTASVSAGFSLLTGNTDRRAASVAADAQRRTDEDRLSASASWDYAEDKNEEAWDLTQRRLGGDFQYDYFLSETSYLLATTRAESDTRADIELRYTIGGGHGLQWVDSDRWKFSTEIGVNFFHEAFRSDAPQNSYLAARMASNLTWNFNDRVKFLQGVEIYPSIEQADDLYTKLDSRMRISLGEAMFSQFQWVFDYDNTPSPGLDRQDHRFLIQIGWEF